MRRAWLLFSQAVTVGVARKVMDQMMQREQMTAPATQK